VCLAGAVLPFKASLQQKSARRRVSNSQRYYVDRDLAVPAGSAGVAAQSPHWWCRAASARL
jgi:hypothetical protein